MESSTWRKQFQDTYNYMNMILITVLTFQKEWTLHAYIEAKYEKEINGHQIFSLKEKCYGD